MPSNEILYSYSSVTIAIFLFLSIIMCNELGFRVGCFVQRKTTEEVKTLTGSIQGSILGLLALLLGFTFSMSMQRYDSRSLALIDEANAIGTTILRTELLPAGSKERASNLLQQYIQLRIEVGQLDITLESERAVYDKKIANVQSQLWDLAVTATELDPRMVTTGSFVKSLNDLIDSQGKRNALLYTHVPEVILFLLFIVFISSGCIMGYSSGLSAKRITAPVILVSLLITLIVFIIIDLDRPKRGLIQVEQTFIAQLKNT